MSEHHCCILVNHDTQELCGKPAKFTLAEAQVVCSEDAEACWLCAEHYDMFYNLERVKQ